MYEKHLEMRLKERIQLFMQTYRHKDGRLSGVRMAALLQTPYATFEHWLRAKDKQPPGCLITLMDILERSPEARAQLGIEDAPSASTVTAL